MRLARALSTVLWSPVNLLQAFATMVWSAGWISAALATAAITRSPRRSLALARRVWAPGLLVVAGSPLTVTGLEQIDRSRPYLFVANHSSWVDIPALFCALPVDLHFLAKRELARVPFLGGYIRAMGMVFVDRGDARSGSATVGRVGELLASGRCVLSFPEGTRSRDGRLGPFKSGGFGAALEQGAAVVPVAVVGTGAILPADGFRVRPGRIQVRIGAPIETAALSPGARAELARRARGAVEALLAAAGPEPATG